MTATLIALLGGTLAGATHATQAGSRAMINTKPEPFSNIAASLGEESLLLAGLCLGYSHPMVFVGLLIAFIVAMVWLLPKLWRSIKRVVGSIGKVARPSTHLNCALLTELRLQSSFPL